MAAQKPNNEMDVAGRAIAQDVLDVLRAGHTQGNCFYLPPAQLERKLYERTNAVLNELGGRWKSGKTKAHVFEGEADEAIGAALATGRYVSARDFGFFPTPPTVAERVVKLAQLEPGMLVLEPEAGVGGLALPAAAVVGIENVQVCELLERNVAKLRQAGFQHVVHGDFLQQEPNPVFDRILMNPPFGGLQDVDHVLHAARFLNPTGRLVAIMAPSFTFQSKAKAEDFRGFLDEVQGEQEEVAAGAFRSSGTDIATVIVSIDACNLPWHQAQNEASRSRMRA